MKLYVPKSARGAKVRYVAVSAHKDDMEMFALGGIAAAYREGGFAGVVLTDGGACPRAPRYAEVDDEDMAAIRTAEQKRAAETGRYEELCLFERSSDAVKEAAKAQGGLVDELAEVLSRYPRVEAAFVHNPFDEHPTHVAAFVTAIRAFSALPEEIRPERVYGCEVWRGLDWLPASRKVAIDVSGTEPLARSLMDCFESQNAVKRYDIASLARRQANATFYQSHEGDTASELIFALDATKLVYGGDIKDFTAEILAEFDASVHTKFF